MKASTSHLRNSKCPISNHKVNHKVNHRVIYRVIYKVIYRVIYKVNHKVNHRVIYSHLFPINNTQEYHNLTNKTPKTIVKTNQTSLLNNNIKLSILINSYRNTSTKTNSINNKSGNKLIGKWNCHELNNYYNNNDSTYYLSVRNNNNNCHIINIDIYTKQDVIKES